MLSNACSVFLLGMAMLLAACGRAGGPAGVVDVRAAARVVVDDAVVRVAPRAEADVRGTLRAGEHLTIVGRAEGGGCRGRDWIQLGPEAFVCEGDVEVVQSPASPRPQPVVRSGQLLPHRYVFVRSESAAACAQPGGDECARRYRQRFSFPVVGRSAHGGVAFVETWKGLFVREEDVVDAAPSSFHGVTLDDDRTLESTGWALAGAELRDTSDPEEVEGRLDALAAVEIRSVSADGWVDVGDGEMIRVERVRRPRAAEIPASVAGTSEPWIDIDLATQTLTLYRGDRPIYTTLMSGGEDTPENRTPTGEFRIQQKLALGSMIRTENPDPAEDYSIEGIPWVQYFQGSYGLHTAFWHEQFGTARSHGCVNLAPVDARRAFEHTSPQLPPGWSSIRATEGDPGTLVRVRD